MLKCGKLEKNSEEQNDNDTHNQKRTRTYKSNC